jgi:hypothetical protein
MAEKKFPLTGHLSESRRLDMLERMLDSFTDQMSLDQVVLFLSGDDQACDRIVYGDHKKHIHVLLGLDSGNVGGLRDFFKAILPRLIEKSLSAEAVTIEWPK